MKSSIDYRKIVDDPILNDEEHYEENFFKEEVYNEIKAEIGDVISYVRCYDPEHYLDILEMFEVAQLWIDATYGTGYKSDENAVVLARHLAKTLVSSMFFNRSFEIASNDKTSIIVRNIGAKLSLFEDGV